MSEIDHFQLDGHALALVLAVLEEGSVTAAARRLGMTQSAVSHGLDRLRRIVGDPLFAKSGRGIVATAHAHALAERARKLLDDMKAFSHAAPFNPSTAELSLTIAANDLQRDLLLPDLFHRLETQLRRIDLRIIPSQSPNAAMLREGRCDLLISPLPPSGTDIVQRLLLEDHYVCFYDATMRAAPSSLEDYLAARHITVVYTDNERLDFDRRLGARAIERDVAISVPSFSGVPAFLRGSNMLATMPSVLRGQLMQGFAHAPVPLAAQGSELAELPMYLVWHQRYQNDPAHIWLRQQLIACAAHAKRLIN